MKPMYLHIYELVIRHESKKKVFEVAGNFVEIDPSTWAERKDVVVEFRLGYGEENDFCMRAAADGWRNVLCDDTQQLVAFDIRKQAWHTASPLQRLEFALHPWSTFVVLPLFALANAGVVACDEILHVGGRAESSSASAYRSMCGSEVDHAFAEHDPGAIDGSVQRPEPVAAGRHRPLHVGFAGDVAFDKNTANF